MQAPSSEEERPRRALPPVVPLAERMALSPQEAAVLLGIGVGTVRDAIRAGDLRAKQIGKDHHILLDDLRMWLASLPDAEYRPRPARVVPGQPRRR